MQPVPLSPALGLCGQHCKKQLDIILLLAEDYYLEKIYYIYNSLII